MKEEIEDNESVELPDNAIELRVKEIKHSKSIKLLGVIKALLSALDDKNLDVKQSIIESIQKISVKNSDVVLHTAIYFWEMHKKISMEHKVSLLNVISSTCKYIDTNLSADLASSVAELAVSELMGEAENEAVVLLTMLCKTHHIQATGGLLNKLKPGMLPHHIIISTMGKLTIANPRGMLSFVKLTLTIILPILDQVREEFLKQAICFTSGKFCEAINDCIINTEDTISEVNKETYEEEICYVFDFLTHNWLKTSRDVKSTEAILIALVSMIPLLPRELNSERIVKLIPICLNLCKKQDVRLAAVKILAVALNCTTVDDREAVRPYVEQMHQILFGFICIFPFEVNRDALLTHYEVLQCSRSLVILYSDESLDRILQQLKSSNANQRARALVILKHLINTLPLEDEGSLHRIALSLQESLGENGALQMIGAITALAARPTVSLLPSQKAVFVRYMVSHCGTKSDDTHTGALYLLATTVDGAELWLWPCLIDALLDTSCLASVTSVLRALSPLASKIVCNENSSMPERNFPGTKVLSRCLELLNDPANRLAIVTFLKAAAPLLGHRVKPYWDEKLSELSQFLQDEKNLTNGSAQQNLIWEEKVIEWLEETVKLEGESWGIKLADELALKTSVPGVAPLLALICNHEVHITLLIELARSHGINREFARAVGICAKRHLHIVLKIMKNFCDEEDARKIPVGLLSFMKDFTKAAAATEAMKAGLLQSYSEIARRANSQEYFLAFEVHVLPWTIKYLNICKELSTKEAGLLVLEQVGKALCSTGLPKVEGLGVKHAALATLMGMLQSSSGYRPLQLYPAILKAAISLIHIPPALDSKKSEVFLSGIIDKTINATTEIVLLLQPDILHQIVDALGILSSEIVSDSADMLAELIDILSPWMQSKTSTERRTALLVLNAVLRSYYNSIKYTHPGGKFDAGKLVGSTLSWCAITEASLRPLVVDCVLLSLNIACRHSSTLSDVTLDEDLKRIKEDIANEDTLIFFETVKHLAKVVSERIPNGEIIGLAKGLIEGLLFCEEASLVASIALSQHFKIKGSMIFRSDVDLIDSIITKMRYMEQASCRNSSAMAIVLLMMHHTEEVTERLLLQPLPLDRAVESCWEVISNNDLGHRALELLLIKLEVSDLFTITSSVYPQDSISKENNNTASFESLAAIVALRHLLQSSNNESLIDKQLARLLSVLLRYLAGWLHVEAPAMVVCTKYGYIPNREAKKINPHMEVYSVLTNVLSIINPNNASSLLNETVHIKMNLIFSSKTHAEENVMSTVHTLIRCIASRNDVLLSMTQFVNKFMNSTIAVQRAVAVTFYAQLIGKLDCGTIWLDTIINSLHEAKLDSSPLVRTYATIGLTRIAYLDQKLIDIYFNNCMDAFLEGLEEPNSEGGSEVVLESLRGLSIFLYVQHNIAISSRVVMALKPFIEKENSDMNIAAIRALGAVAINWQRTVSVDDDSIDHLLWCLPCLIVRLDDSNIMVAKIAQETLYKIASLLQYEELSSLIHTNLEPQAKFNFEAFSKELIDCLNEKYPQRAEELRNAVTQYCKSENSHTRATSALLLGLLGSPRSEDIHRLLQLLQNKEDIVRLRASQALSYCFSL